VAAVVARARSVLFDFDGPVCGLFADYPIERTARRVHTALAAGFDLAGLPIGTDPHGILRSVARRAARSPLALAALRRAGSILTDAEHEAARGASLAPHVGELIGRMAERGLSLAITSNNAAGPVHDFLRLAGLDHHFAGRIFGRSPDDPALMKPHPDCVDRALAALGARPEETLLLGDSVVDAQAAGERGVTFIGYATKPWKAEELYAAGAAWVVDDHRTLAAAFAPAG